jgi:hypothetical protein
MTVHVGCEFNISRFIVLNSARTRQSRAKGRVYDATMRAGQWKNAWLHAF